MCHPIFGISGKEQHGSVKIIWGSHRDGGRAGGATCQWAIISGVLGGRIAAPYAEICYPYAVISGFKHKIVEKMAKICQNNGRNKQNSISPYAVKMFWLEPCGSIRYQPANRNLTLARTATPSKGNGNLGHLLAGVVTSQLFIIFGKFMHHEIYWRTLRLDFMQWNTTREIDTQKEKSRKYFLTEIPPRPCMHNIGTHYAYQWWKLRSHGTTTDTLWANNDNVWHHTRSDWHSHRIRQGSVCRSWFSLLKCFRTILVIDTRNLCNVIFVK